MRVVNFTWIERHCEKVACWTAMLILCGAAWRFVLNSPNQLVFLGRETTPGELLPALHSEALRLEARLDALTPKTKFESPMDLHRFVQQRDRGVLGDIEETIPGLARGVLPIACEFRPPVDDLGIVFRPVRAITPRAPVDVRVYTGRCLIASRTENTAATQPSEPVDTEIGWVRVIGRFDYDAQRADFEAAGYPEYATRAYVAGIEIERRESLHDDRYSAWEPIGSHTLRDSYPRAVFADQTRRWLNRDELTAAFLEVRNGQDKLLRPVFEEVHLGDAPPNEMYDAAVDSTEVEKSSGLFWFDDRTAQPGGAYQYRVRVICWNRLIGRLKETIDPVDAERPVLIGDWSAATAPIVAAPQTRFFVMGANLSRDGVTVEVWKWRAGKWLRKVFSTRVGEQIGALCRVRTEEAAGEGQPRYEDVDMRTGATLLDFREAQQSHGGTVIAVCSLGDGGIVVERDAVADRASIERRALMRP